MAKKLKTKVPELSDCPDCGVEAGQAHIRGCDVERCSACGHQRLGCMLDLPRNIVDAMLVKRSQTCGNRKGQHDPSFARWTGIWPGVAECKELGLVHTEQDHQWPNGKGSYGIGTAKLNHITPAMRKAWFVKPKVR